MTYTGNGAGLSVVVNRSMRACPNGRGPFITAAGANSYGQHTAAMAAIGPGTGGSCAGEVTIEHPAVGELPALCDYARIRWTALPTNAGWPAPYQNGFNCYWRFFPGASAARARGRMWQRTFVRSTFSSPVTIIPMWEDGLGPATPGWVGTMFLYGAPFIVPVGTAWSEVFTRFDLPAAQVVPATTIADNVSCGWGITLAQLNALTMPGELYLWTDVVDLSAAPGDSSIERDTLQSAQHVQRIGQGLWGRQIPNQGGNTGLVQIGFPLNPPMISSPGIVRRQLTGFPLAGTYYFRWRAGVQTQLYNATPDIVLPTNMMAANGGIFVAKNFDVQAGDVVQIQNSPWEADAG